jgi:predicted metal-dependent peptidase
MEYYYEKLLTKLDDPDKDDGDGEGEGEGDGEGSGSGGGIPDTIDEHIWDGSGEEKDMLEATEDLIKRAMIKQRCGFTDLPQSIKDLLSDIETRKVELDYKQMILSAIKRSASGHDRLHTWSRKSRRFGTKAPGTKIGDMPKLNFYLDTSGSISTEELNEFLEVVDNFLRTGNRKCRLNMFHTSNYYSSDYKLGQRLGKDGIQKEVQSGGTDLAESMKDIFKRKADLNVIVTDGYYGNVDVEAWMKANDHWPQTIFIISKEGEKKHPLERLGLTIKIPQSLQPDKKL